MGFRQNVLESIPENAHGRMTGLAELVNEAYREDNLGSDEVSILYDELSGHGKPEFPVVGIPHGDFYQRLGDRWVQAGTETESVEADSNVNVSLYTIRTQNDDFIREQHSEEFPGETGEIVRDSIDSFDNTFSDMGEIAKPFMKYAAERKQNTRGLNSQEWYEQSLDLDQDIIEVFDYFVDETQSVLRKTFGPKDDSITMLRGVSSDVVEEHGRWSGDDLILESGCVEHWTTSPTAASNYGNGYIIMADIPVDDILVANPVNSGTVMNLPESYIARGTEEYSEEEVYSADEADTLEFAETIIESVK